MNNIRNYTTEQIAKGIMRCKARLAGVIPMGILTRKMVTDALRQYREELGRRADIERRLFNELNV
jgi:hypothetical protein